MATLYIIRHGEPEIKGVFLGRMDPPLSQDGHRAVAAALADLQVQVTYTSPLRRARQTASYIPSPELIELAALQEVDFGVWTGKTWHEIETHWTELACKKAEDWLGIDPPEAESWSSLVSRLKPVYARISAGKSPAAVVAHQGVNAALLNLINGNNPLTFTQRYGEVIRIELD